MASREELKAWVVEEIDSHADDIVRASTTILGHPEPGFARSRRPSWSPTGSLRWAYLSGRNWQSQVFVAR